MNTVTQSETLALSAVAAAAAVSSAAMTGDSVTVSEVAPYELHLIPLSRLRPPSRNVRQSGGTAIPELAASIARVGLLQNLTVITSPDEQWFEVVAGRRRLAALKLLVKRHKLGKDHLVPCLLVPDTSARTVSLSENVQREAMTPPGRRWWPKAGRWKTSPPTSASPRWWSSGGCGWRTSRPACWRTTSKALSRWSS